VLDIDSDQPSAFDNSDATALTALLRDIFQDVA
jgi:putative methionine-R-sulfoxide reductase with GAF domain